MKGKYQKCKTCAFSENEECQIMACDCPTNGFKYHLTKKEMMDSLDNILKIGKEQGRVLERR